ncbi:hypothetical protein HEAR0192 [Herminiimonas arsenicoxydans]|uniref:Uncharacterized protein n=1 Tax=Herminiimonas arsenicoxydans TaxID=204773 RepID=A4G1N9_HERAR|nr:hypothetical protein HEAR0192 [Herminiimonas arsenicoxydans]
MSSLLIGDECAHAIRQARELNIFLDSVHPDRKIGAHKTYRLFLRDEGISSLTNGGQALILLMVIRCSA